MSRLQEKKVAWYGRTKACGKPTSTPLLERHCNLHQKSELQPEEYLSLSILVTEYIPYLADKPQTARETLF